jgi:hypothetical protein
LDAAGNDLLTNLIQLTKAAFWCSAHQNRRWSRTPAAALLLAASVGGTLLKINTAGDPRTILKSAPTERS